jgi:TonB family protein
MSSTSFHSEELPRSHERRRFIRQRVRSLAYLDVGPDNGGIVLNLSENGIALQAVNPFIDQTRVSLRIEPAKSRKRIEASAEITWLSDSKTEAGLRFLELSDEARDEIADWVSAEADAVAQRSLDDSASPQTRQVPSKSITEAPPHLRGKWSIMLGDSTSQESLENQKAPNPLPNSSSGRRNPEAQPTAVPPKKLLGDPATNPDSNVVAIQAPSGDENQSHVSSHIVSEHASGVAELPPPESPLPALAASSDRLGTPAASDAIAEDDEILDARAPGMKSTLREFLPGQFRKSWAIAALCGCTALVFLLLGIAIARGLMNPSRAKSSAHEDSQTATAFSPLGALGSASRHEASGSKARHPNVGGTANTSHLESPSKHNDENPQPGPQEGATNSLIAKFSIPIDTPPPTTKSDSQNASAPSLPVLSVYPSGVYNLPVDPNAINPPPPAGAERRSDCYLLYRVEPLYPREAKEQRIEGTVTIHLLIGTDGRVRSLRELSGPGHLVPAALAAARDWRFMPALLNGVPIDSEQDVNIAFRLPR